MAELSKTCLVQGTKMSCISNPRGVYMQSCRRQTYTSEVIHKVGVGGTNLTGLLPYLIKEIYKGIQWSKPSATFRPYSSVCATYSSVYVPHTAVYVLHTAVYVLQTYMSAVYIILHEVTPWFWHFQYFHSSKLTLHFMDALSGIPTSH